MKPTPSSTKATGSPPQTPCLLQAPPFGRRRPIVGWRIAGPAMPLDRIALAPKDEARVMAALRSVVEKQVGGEFWVDTPIPDAPVRLLRPQTPAGADAMLRAALAETAAASILLSAPDQPWTQRLARTATRLGAAVHLGPVAPWRLLAIARDVEIEGDDNLGPLALASGISVRCAAPCDLAGWGLTIDADHIPRRGAASLAQAAHGALIWNVAYRNPFTNAPAPCEEIIEILADWRRVLDRNRAIACCAGMSLWKRPAVAVMLHTGVRAPLFHRRAGSAVRAAARQGGGVAVWTSRAPAKLASEAAASAVPLAQVEDGFLRSAGLGADLTPPCSIVVDMRAPHYAADRPSDLEVLLAETTFDAAIVARADRLIAITAALGLTKYNLGGRAGMARPMDRRCVLVAGQVADDLSVRLGGAGVAGNLDLLARVRAAEPDAHILFKPHPDVEAGHRPGAVRDAEALAHADEIVRGQAMASLLAAVDAVHVLTSLTGFEALLRGREVVTHGQPFYAGWGLTRDLNPPPRRTRRLSLAELVAGALILYPHYLDPVTGLPCPPEVLVARLADRSAQPNLLNRAWRMQARVRSALRGVRREIAA